MSLVALSHNFKFKDVKVNNVGALDNIATELEERANRSANVAFGGDVDREKGKRFIEVANLEPPTKLAEVGVTVGLRFYNNQSVRLADHKRMNASLPTRLFKTFA